MSNSSPRTQIVPVAIEQFDRIYSSLLVQLNPSISREKWRRLFDWGWPNPEDHTGFALLDTEGDFVGFVATIYSDQSVDGRTERFCNLSSWIVRDGFGSSGVGLLMPVLRRSDLTITNLTSIPSVNAMFRSLGFRTLETHIRIFTPLSGLNGREERGSTIEIKENPSPNDSTISGRMRRDLLALSDRCYQWLLRSDDGTCHLAFTLGRRQGLRTIRIHHVSSPHIFAGAMTRLGLRFLSRHRALQFETDERLLSGVEVPYSRRVELPQTRLFRSSSVSASAISNLYSELPLLNL